MLDKTQRPRILIVEDDVRVLELIVTRLEIAGYSTVTARDGEVAIERVKEVRADAIILDINMPKLDGFAVLEHLKTTGLSRVVPVMVLTARNMMGDVQRAVLMGARDFLAKPFKDDVLLARVARLVRRPHQAPLSTAEPWTNPKPDDSLMI